MNYYKKKYNPHHINERMTTFSRTDNLQNKIISSKHLVLSQSQLVLPCLILILTWSSPCLTLSLPCLSLVLSLLYLILSCLTLPYPCLTWPYLVSSLPCLTPLPCLTLPCQYPGYIKNILKHHLQSSQTRVVSRFIVSLLISVTYQR